MTTTKANPFEIGSGFWNEEHRQLGWDVSRWQRLLFEARHEVSPKLRSKTGIIENTLTKHAIESEWAGEGKGHHEAERELRPVMKQDSYDFGNEIFARLYSEKLQEVDPIEKDVPEWMDKVQQVLNSSEEFRLLQESVEGDPDFSALGTIRILEVVGDALPGILKEIEEEAEDQDSKPGEDGEGEGEGEPSPAQEALAAALAGAARAAMDEASEKKEMLSAIAPGSEFAPPSVEQVDPRRLQLAEVISADPRLKEIIRRAGRIRRLSKSNRHVPSEVARDTIDGLERGGDISRILPSELAKIRHPILRKITMRNILERKALQYKYTGTEPLGRGPVVVLLDESGSMRGEPHTWARAIGLACVAMATREHRDIKVAGFNFGITTVHRVDSRGRGTTAQSPSATPKRCSPTDVSLAIAATSCGGGTSFAQAILWALDHGLEDPRADLIFVTDGDDYLSSPEILGRLQASKDDGLRVYGVTINGGRLSEAVQAICDEVIALDEEDDKGKAASVISL